MNKKVRGILFIIVGIFYTYLIMMSRYYLYSTSSTIPKFLLTLCLVIFGKLSLFISILSIIYGIVLCMFSKIKLKFHKSKIIALIILIFSTSIINTIKKLPSILPETAYDSGIILLGIGFNDFDSGGLLGTLLSMPIYKILLNEWTLKILIIINIISFIIIFRDVFQFFFSLIIDLIKYYLSDEYKKKKKILKAKKETEKNKYIESKKKRERELREQFIGKRKEKIDNKIALKPKNEQFGDDIFYSERELIEKEKEWHNNYNRIRENKKQKQIFGFYHEKNEEYIKNEQKNDNINVDKNITNIERTMFTNDKIILDNKNNHVENKNNFDEQKLNEEKEKLIIDEPQIINSDVDFVDRLSKVEDYNNSLNDVNKEEFISDDEKYDILLGNINKKIEENDEKNTTTSKIEFEENKKNEQETFNDTANDTDRSYNNVYLNNELPLPPVPVEEYKDLIDRSINTIFKSQNMDPRKKIELERSIAENVHHLEEVLKEFGIEAKVVNYDSGPTITRYEITIPRGVKVSKVTSLSDDIQMSLASESIRIEAPIPGKNTIGIETPNRIKEPVYFSNLIRNPKLNDGDLSVVLGKDVVGEDKILDIAKMPHLLIAGTTGSGKSVAINTIISTLITKKSEKEVKFIMIDPKMVELTPYNDIPHQLVPVIYDPNQAAVALQWSVNEMERRYKLLMSNGVRNIKSYNDIKGIERMPYIVIVIDELADLMMVAANSVETSIARIAQKARAVGIHLLLATQRPSADVITGIIKANLPSRISFALKSQIDSRTILDSTGAEKLLGQGDMLLSENGSTKLQRIQGAFISDEEVMNLTNLLKKNRKVEYNQNVLEEIESTNPDLDPLYQNAIDIIKEEGRVSISLLQGRLKVGFPRAQTIYNQLKETGVVSSDNELLIDDI